MNTGSFIVYTKTNDITKILQKMLKLDLMLQMNYESECDFINRLLRKGKIKKVIGFLNNELGGNIMIMFVGLKAKTYSFLIDDASKDEKAKGTINLVRKRKL